MGLGKIKGMDLGRSASSEKSRSENIVSLNLSISPARSGSLALMLANLPRCAAIPLKFVGLIAIPLASHLTNLGFVIIFAVKRGSPNVVAAPAAASPGLPVRIPAEAPILPCSMLLKTFLAPVPETFATASTSLRDAVILANLFSEPLTGLD